MSDQLTWPDAAVLIVFFLVVALVVWLILRQR